MIKFSKFLENKNMNEGLLDAASRFGKHIVQGGREAMDAISGPAAKFDASLKSIEDLAASLEKNPKLQNYPALTKQGVTLAQYLRAITRVLRREKDNLPELRSGDSQYNPRYEQAPNPWNSQNQTLGSQVAQRQQGQQGQQARGQNAAPGTPPPTGDMRRVV